MREEHHPPDFDVEARFPDKREIEGFPEQNVYLAEDDDGCYVIIDERQFAGHLDPEDPHDQQVLNRIVRVMVFPGDDQRQSWLRAQLRGLLP